MVKNLNLDFSDIPYLSTTDVDYQTGAPALKPFYEYNPELQAISDAIQVRSTFYTDRQLLVDVLSAQYKEYEADENAYSYIHQLLEEDTYTMTTAHQPSLMTGPLYTITKAISVIKAAQLASRETGKKILPVYIVGGEDHDFEEVNHFYFFNNRIEWDTKNTGGPVGRYHTDSIQPVIEEILDRLSDNETDKYLAQLIRKTHRPGRLYAVAYADLFYQLLGKYGLIILRMDDPNLKEAFCPIMKKEILESLSHKTVRPIQDKLEQDGYKPQAYVRELNLFYLGNNIRERLLPDPSTDKFIFESTGKACSREELAKMCEELPEQFSPNVVMRPLYQELILPNLAYIGGGGELAYWLERKDQFQEFGIPYPMLIRRDSILWIPKREYGYLSEEGINGKMIFSSADEWVRHFLENHADIELDLEAEKQHIDDALNKIVEKASILDPTLAKSLEAEKTKLKKSVDQFESRIFRTAKQKNEQKVAKLRRVKEKLFPDNGLMERRDNLLPFFLRYGDVFFETLLEHLDPFDRNFKVLFEEG